MQFSLKFSSLENFEKLKWSCAPCRAYCAERVMMLHTKHALGRAGCLLPLYSSSASATFKLCGAVRVTTPACQYSSESTRTPKDIFPTSSPLIDEPTEKIHKQLAKLIPNDNKPKKGMEKFSARLFPEETPKINPSLVSCLFSSFSFTLISSCSLLDMLLNLLIVAALRLALYQLILIAQSLFLWYVCFPRSIIEEDLMLSLG